MTEEVPKLLGPAGHAIVDYVTAAGLLSAGFGLLDRHRPAATLAFVMGGLALGASLFTDYPGGLFRKLSFKTHGTIDAMHAIGCAAMPTLMGFADDTEARIFHAQAMLEAGVIATTDWDAAPGRPMQGRASA